MRVYVDGGNLAGMSMQIPNYGMEFVMTVEAFSWKIPAGMLEIPSDYKEVSEEEFYKASFGF